MRLPTQEELQALRKGLRKRKLPRVFDGMWCSEPGVGGVKVTAAGADFHVEWVSFDGGVKSASKHAEWSNCARTRVLRCSDWRSVSLFPRSSRRRRKKSWTRSAILSRRSMRQSRTETLLTSGNIGRRSGPDTCLGFNGRLPAKLLMLSSSDLSLSSTSRVSRTRKREAPVER